MFADRFHPAADGTRLHYRDYPGAADRPPVLCLHGLTRNPRDFEGVAARLNAAGWRVIVPSIRGRGDSAWADPKTYALPVYLKDMDALAEHASFARASAYRHLDGRAADDAHRRRASRPRRGGVPE